MSERLRIACVQHGDFVEAVRRLREGQGEPYFGMRASVAATEDLLAQADASLILSIDGTPGRSWHGATEVLAPPALRMPSALLYDELRAQYVVHQLRRFRPTHVVLRAHGQIGLRTAQWCTRNRVPALVALGAAVWTDQRSARWINKRFMRELNGPMFARVYNWKPTSCASMVEYGLNAGKALPYESGNARRPQDHGVKKRDATACRIVFAARMIADKGPEDVIDAVALLRARGVPAEAILFGDGPFLPRVRERATALPPGVVQTPGEVSNEVLFETFRASSFACVPTRPGFIEGMPMALTEALASRTPVIASDCKVFTSAFRDGEGVRLFRATNVAHLAEVVAEVWNDPASYESLSTTTSAAFARVDSGRSFVDVISAWKTEIFGAPA